jgi:nucleoside-diphosphate-sugar epimerase
MKILILGGTGLLSGAMARVARDAGHAVTIFTRGQSQRPAPEGITALVGDRHDAAAFGRLGTDHHYDAVIDCLCYTAEDARADVETFAGRTGHLVMISTDFVYGGEPRRLPLTEEAPREAAGGYGRNKVAAEELFFAAWRERRFPVTILRPPHIMGEGGLLGTGSLRGRDPGLLAALRQGEPQFLLDGGTLLIQPVVHRDIAAATLAVLGATATHAGLQHRGRRGRHDPPLLRDRGRGARDGAGRAVAALLRLRGGLSRARSLHPASLLRRGQARARCRLRAADRRARGGP